MGADPAKPTRKYSVTEARRIAAATAASRMQARREKMRDHLENLYESIGPAIAAALSAFRRPDTAVTILQGIADTLEQEAADLGPTPDPDAEESLRSLRLLLSELDEIDLDAIADSSPYPTP